VKEIIRSNSWFSFFFILFILGVNGVWAADFQEIEKILSAPGQLQEGAFVVRFARSDIKLVIERDPIPTALGFGSWTAWKVWTLK
jgi:hypothetical protein